jgi:hypothetical protein
MNIDGVCTRAAAYSAQRHFPQSSKFCSVQTGEIGGQNMV